jgi:hypothetical protein
MAALAINSWSFDATVFILPPEAINRAFFDYATARGTISHKRRRIESDWTQRVPRGGSGRSGGWRLVDGAGVALDLELAKGGLSLEFQQSGALEALQSTENSKEQG